jgi:hypothetical protein
VNDQHDEFERHRALFEERRRRAHHPEAGFGFNRPKLANPGQNKPILDRLRGMTATQIFIDDPQDPNR